MPSGSQPLSVEKFKRLCTLIESGLPRNLMSDFFKEPILNNLHRFSSEEIEQYIQELPENKYEFSFDKQEFQIENVGSLKNNKLILKLNNDHTNLEELFLRATLFLDMFIKGKEFNIRIPLLSQTSAFTFDSQMIEKFRFETTISFQELSEHLSILKTNAISELLSSFSELNLQFSVTEQDVALIVKVNTINIFGCEIQQSFFTLWLKSLSKISVQGKAIIKLGDLSFPPLDISLTLADNGLGFDGSARFPKNEQLPLFPAIYISHYGIYFDSLGGIGFVSDFSLRSRLEHGFDKEKEIGTIKIAPAATLLTSTLIAIFPADFVLSWAHLLEYITGKSLPELIWLDPIKFEGYQSQQDNKFHPFAVIINPSNKQYAYDGRISFYKIFGVNCRASIQVNKGLHFSGYADHINIGDVLMLTAHNNTNIGPLVTTDIMFDNLKALEFRLSTSLTILQAIKVVADLSISNGIIEANLAAKLDLVIIVLAINVYLKLELARAAFSLRTDFSLNLDVKVFDIDLVNVAVALAIAFDSFKHQANIAGKFNAAVLSCKLIGLEFEFPATLFSLMNITDIVKDEVSRNSKKFFKNVNIVEWFKEGGKMLSKLLGMNTEELEKKTDEIKSLVQSLQSGIQKFKDHMDKRLDNLQTDLTKEIKEGNEAVKKAIISATAEMLDAQTKQIQAEFIVTRTAIQDMSNLLLRVSDENNRQMHERFDQAAKQLGQMEVKVVERLDYLRGDLLEMKADIKQEFTDLKLRLDDLTNIMKNQHIEILEQLLKIERDMKWLKEAIKLGLLIPYKKAYSALIHEFDEGALHGLVHEIRFTATDSSTDILAGTINEEDDLLSGDSRIEWMINTLRGYLCQKFQKIPKICYSQSVANPLIWADATRAYIFVVSTKLKKEQLKRVTVNSDLRELQKTGEQLREFIYGLRSNPEFLASLFSEYRAQLANLIDEIEKSGWNSPKYQQQIQKDIFALMMRKMVSVEDNASKKWYQQLNSKEILDSDQVYLLVANKEKVQFFDSEIFFSNILPQAALVTPTVEVKKQNVVNVWSSTGQLVVAVDSGLEFFPKLSPLKFKSLETKTKSVVLDTDFVELDDFIAVLQNHENTFQVSIYTKQQGLPQMYLYDITEADIRNLYGLKQGDNVKYQARMTKAPAGKNHLVIVAAHAPAGLGIAGAISLWPIEKDKSKVLFKSDFKDMVTFIGTTIVPDIPKHDPRILYICGFDIKLLRIWWHCCNTPYVQNDPVSTPKDYVTASIPTAILGGNEKGRFYVGFKNGEVRSYLVDGKYFVGGSNDIFSDKLLVQQLKSIIKLLIWNNLGKEYVLSVDKDSSIAIIPSAGGSSTQLQLLKIQTPILITYATTLLLKNLLFEQVTHALEIAGFMKSAVSNKQCRFRSLFEYFQDPLSFNIRQDSYQTLINNLKDSSSGLVKALAGVEKSYHLLRAVLNITFREELDFYPVWQQHFDSTLFSQAHFNEYIKANSQLPFVYIWLLSNTFHHQLDQFEQLILTASIKAQRYGSNRSGYPLVDTVLRQINCSKGLVDNCMSPAIDYYQQELAVMRKFRQEKPPEKLTVSESFIKNSKQSQSDAKTDEQIDKNKYSKQSNSFAIPGCEAGQLDSLGRSLPPTLTVFELYIIAFLSSPRVVIDHAAQWSYLVFNSIPKVVITKINTDESIAQSQSIKILHDIIEGNGRTITSEEGSAHLFFAHPTYDVTVVPKGYPSGLAEKVMPSFDEGTYNKSACKAIEWYGQPSVMCSDTEGRTTMIYTPHLSPRLFDQLDGNILLGALAVKGISEAWCYLKAAVSTWWQDSAENSENIIYLSEYECKAELTEMMQRLNDLSNQIDKLVVLDAKRWNWARWTLEDQHEVLDKLTDQGHITEDEITDFYAEIDTLETDLLEELNQCSLVDVSDVSFFGAGRSQSISTSQLSYELLVHTKQHLMPRH